MHCGSMCAHIALRHAMGSQDAVHLSFTVLFVLQTHISANKSAGGAWAPTRCEHLQPFPACVLDVFPLKMHTVQNEAETKYRLVAFL